jgi:hypothetical protein
VHPCPPLKAHSLAPAPGFRYNGTMHTPPHAAGRGGGVDWRAQWIWHGDDPSPFHSFLFVRRSFTLDRAPRSALLHITATDRYRLFVNGEYLGRGPERCDPRFQSFDTHDVAAGLRAGPNVIAVQAYFYGCSTGFGRDGRAGLLAQLEVDGEPRIVSDGSWRVRPARGWRRDAKPVGIGVGVTEVLDTRLDPAEWAATDFDDAAWDTASLVALATGQWCSRPEPRSIPFLEERAILPRAALRTGETLELDDTLSTVDVPEMMAREIHEELRRARMENEAALAGDGTGPAVAASSAHAYRDDVFDGIRDPFVLLDMGKQVNAFPRLDVEGAPGDIVDVAWGEQLVGGRVAPLLTSTRCADRYILRGGRQVIQAFEYKSFRYLQVSIRTKSPPVLIHSAGAVTWQYPAEVLGAFDCSNDTLSRLWKATVTTTELCTDDAFMDSPLREKRNWLGDGSHALLGAWAAWGDVPVVRRYFELVRQGAFGDGLPRMFFPGSDFVDPRTKIATAIPQHALVWAARVMEHYRLFGDRSLLEDLYPMLGDLDGWCLRHVNGDGLLDRLPFFNWLDWTPVDVRGANFGTNAFRLHMLDDLAAIAGIVGREADRPGWEARAATLRETLRRLYWDEDRGIFIDSIFRGRRTGIASEIGNACAVLFDIAGPGRTDKVADALAANDGRLAPATPLFFHYIPQALFTAGRHRQALDLIIARFARMMEVSDTIWEGWSRHAMLPHITESSTEVPAVVPGGWIEAIVPAHRPCAVSLAHCGGLGSGLLLLTHVLGIQPRGPGFEGCVVTPRIDLLSRASGAFPSPKGVISVAWETAGDGVRARIDLPAGLTGELRLPSGSRQLPAGRRTEVTVGP